MRAGSKLIWYVTDSCEQVLDDLVTSQLQQLTSAVTQLNEVVNSRLLTTVYELEAEVAELRTAMLPSHTTGTKQKLLWQSLVAAMAIGKS